MPRVVAACGPAKTLIHHPAALGTMRDRSIGASMIEIVATDRLLPLWMIHSDPPDDVGERYQLTTSASIVKIAS